MNWQATLAVARTTILITMRQAWSLIFVALMGIAVIALALSIEGDNTLSGQLRVALNWSHGFISGILVLFAVYLGISSISWEFKGKQILMLDVKPIARWQLLFGKWLGGAFVLLWLQLLLAVLIFACLNWLTASPDLRLDSSTGLQRSLDYDRIWREFMVSRSASRPTVAALEQSVTRRLEELIKDGTIRSSDAEDPALLDWARTAQSLQLLNLGPGASQSFVFEGLPRADDPEAELVLRARFYGRKAGEGASQVRLSLAFGNSASSKQWTRRLALATGQTHEISASASALGEDGKLLLVVTNLDSGPDGVKLVIPALDGLEVLIPTGSFMGNFLRGQALLSVRLLMLLAFAISFSSFLKTQVAAFVMVSVLVSSTLGGFLASELGPKVESYQEFRARLEAEAKTEGLVSVMALKARPLIPLTLGLLPRFSETDPRADWESGREISWGRVIWRFTVDCGLRAGLAVALAIWLFGQRELGLPDL